MCTKRTIEVYYNNILIKKGTATKGVPQGSVLSPILFNIYVSKIEHYIGRCSNLQFADDCAITYKGQDLEEIRNALEEGAKSLIEWLESRGLKVSLSKTNLIIFENDFRTEALQLRIGEATIAEVNFIKFLGIYFDKRLSWHFHIKHIKNRALQACNMLKALAGISWGAHPLNLIKVYKGYVRAILEWGSLCYSNAKKSLLTTLDTVQNKALRIVSGLMRSTSIFGLHKLLNIPTLDTRRKFLINKYLIKANSIEQHKIITKLKCLTLTLERNNRKTSKLAFVIKRFNDIQSLIREHTIFSSKLPICYEYPIDSQLLSAETDRDLGQIIKNLPDEIKDLYFENVIKESYNNFNIIFTDASKKSYGGREHTAAAFYHQDENIERVFNLNKNIQVEEAEAYAIWKGIRYAWEEGHEKTLIVTDAKRVVDKIAKPYYGTDSLSIILDIKCKIMLQEREGKRVKILWLPRLSVIGSRRADFLAKRGDPEQREEYFATNYNSLVQKIINNHQSDWHFAAASLLEKDKKKKYIKNTSFVMPDKEGEKLKRFNREECVQYLRLISGYVADPEFLYKIKIRTSCSCICGERICNLSHILWDCTQHLIPRFELKESLGNLGYNTTDNIQEILINRNIKAFKILFKFLKCIEFKI